MNGFEALAQYDVNGDGRITKDDSVFDRLRVWVDEGTKGGSRMALKTLRELGVQELDLAFTADHEVDIFGNEAREISRYLDASGQWKYFADLWFLTISKTSP